MARERLDVLLVQRELVESREKAQALILAGEVQVNGRVVSKAGTNVATDAVIGVRAAMPYVSRGGYKLAAALDAFQLDVRDKICADIGASTGGFTDVLLQRGAAKVYAIDVGKGILHWKMRTDSRVVVMEETNARFVGSLPEPVSLVTVDASFISLKILLPVVKKWISPSPLTPLPQGEGFFILWLLECQLCSSGKRLSIG